MLRPAFLAALVALALVIAQPQTTRAAIAFAGSASGIATNELTDTNVTSSAFTPANGEVLLIGFATANDQAGDPTVTGGSLTYTKVLGPINCATDGQSVWLYRATVSGSPGSMTVDSAYDTASKASIIVRRYTGADTTDATGSASNCGNTKTLAVSITTNNDNSYVASFIGSSVVWASGDIPSGFGNHAAADTGGLSAERSSVASADRSTTTAGDYSHTWSSADFHSNNVAIAVELTAAAEAGGGPANTHRVYINGF